MSNRLDNIPVLYSVGTKLAYLINQNYYNGVHYVWCAENFNSLTQAPTSNPLTIMQRYLQVSIGTDEHCHEIPDNLSGILRGSEAKCKAGIITDKQKEQIQKLTSVPTWDAFLPVLYVIPTSKVKSKCLEVPLKDRASTKSYEYKILELCPGEYEAFVVENILDFLIDIPRSIVPDNVLMKGSGSK